MKPLDGTSERMDDLIFAALANPSGRHKGRTLLEYCFHKMDVRQTFRHFSWEDRATYLELYEMLLEDGADAGAFLRKGVDDFAYLQKATCESLRLICVLLAGDQAYERHAAGFLREDISFGKILDVTTTLLRDLEQGLPVHIAKDVCPCTCPCALDDRNTQDGADTQDDVVFLYEDCIRGIHELAQPRLASLEDAFRNGADASFLSEGLVSPIFTAERLLSITSDAMRLLAETMHGRGAWEAVRERASLCGNFFALEVCLRDLIRGQY